MAKRIYTHSELLSMLEISQAESIRLKEENKNLRLTNAAHVADVCANFEHAEKLAENARQLSALVFKYQKELGI